MERKLFTCAQKTAIALMLIACSFEMKAQQLPHYSQYMLNDYVINPAVGGKMPYYEAKSDNRYQWNGIVDAPRTYILSVNGPTKNRKVGLGGYLFTDITGPTRRTGINFTYAYHMNLNEKIKLSMGLSAGLLQFAVDGSKITLRDPADLVISNGYQSVLVPDFGFGVYLYSDKFWFGASAPQIYQSKLKFFDYTTSTLSQLETHYFITGGYKLNIGDDFQIEPSTIIKFVEPAPVQFDAGARFIWQQKLWVGGAYRNMDAITALVGYTYQEYLTIGYSFDINTSNIKNYSSGTHEIMIGIRFKKQNQTASSF